MTTLHIQEDARRAFDILKRGGTAIIPNDTGYGLVGGSKEAVMRIFAAKKRGGHKRNVILGDSATQRDMQMLGPREQSMIDAITLDYDLPLGPIAPFRPDHPLLQNIDPDFLRASTANGTVAMLLNAGPFYKELCRLSREEVHPILGSSANLSGTGTKWRVEDIQPELHAIADITIDYGLRKYAIYQRAGTLINFTNMQVIRIGICYEQIRDILQRHFKVELPPDPGLAALPSGHLNEFALREGE